MRKPRKATERELLSDRMLQSLLKAEARRPTGEQHAIFDVLVPHLCVRVSAKGKIAWVVVRRQAGSPRPVRVTLGHYPLMGLEKARTEARTALEQLIAGKRPAAERERQLAEQRENEEQTFAAVAKRYLDHIAEKKSRKRVESLIDLHLTSRWGERQIESISRREIVSMVEAVKDGTPAVKGEPAVKGGKAASRQALIYLKRIFTFAVARDLLTTSPADKVSPSELIGQKKPRQRVLSDDEIRLLWDAVPWDTSPGVEARGHWPLAPMTRLLLMLGVRPGELSKAKWSEVDLAKATWMIPPNTKTEEPHFVPLPRAAVLIFKSLPRFAGSDLIFTVDGRKPSNSWHKFRVQVRRKMGKVEPWTHHDLRRTARTNFSRLGAPTNIAEMMLGHAQPGIHATYDVHKFERERRSWLEKWSRRIEEIASPTAPVSKVVNLR